MKNKMAQKSKKAIFVRVKYPNGCETLEQAQLLENIESIEFLKR